MLIAVNSTAHCSCCLALLPTGRAQKCAVLVSPFPHTQDFILFVCLFYLWKGFSCSWQSGTGNDCSNEGECILLAAQPQPSLLVHAAIFTLLAVAGAAHGESLVLEAGALLPELFPSPCSRTF